MTLPNGAAGLVAGIEFGITHGTLGSLQNLTEDAARQFLAVEMQASTAWNAASAAVYDGLQRGISYALAIIQAIVQRIFNTIEQFPGVKEALDFVEHVPGFSELQGLMSAAVDQLDGTAQAVVRAVLNADGTAIATFSPYVTGAITALIDRLDGTVSGLQSLIINGDGTALFGAAATANPVGALIDSADGTAMSIAAGLQNLVNPVGTANYALGNWTSLLANAGLQSANELSASLQGLIPAALNQFNGTALTTGLPQIVENLNGTATLLEQDVANSVASLTNQLDGTVRSVASQVAHTTQYATTNWNALLTQTGLANPAQLVSSLSGLIPAAIDQLDGTAVQTGVAQIIQNLDGTATLVQQAGSNAVAALIDQADGTAMSLAKSLSNAGASATALLGNNLTAAASAGQQVINSLFGAFGLGGLTAIGATPVQANQAATSAQQNIASNAAGLAALNALLAQASNGGGTSVSINFSSYANGALPGAFTAVANIPGTGFPAAAPVISGGTLTDPGGGSTPGYSALYNAATTVGDQQIIAGVFSGVSSGNYPILYGRANSAGTSFVYAIKSSSTWRLTVVVAGVASDQTFFADTFTNGAVYSLVLGTGAVGNRVYQILKNGTPLPISFGGGATTYTEAGTTSQLGASYRGGGVAVYGTATCSTWTFIDNSPPAAVGSGFRAYRASTGTVSLTAGDQLLPNSFFDTTDTVTSDLTSAPATNNKVTVSVAGWYVVTVCLYFSIGSGGSAGPILYKNGSVIRRGTNYVSLTGASYYPLSASFVVYCAAGDYLQPGVYCDAGAVSAIKGEATGTYAYWEVAFSNRGTLS